jgi:hypothetical protein
LASINEELQRVAAEAASLKAAFAEAERRADAARADALTEAQRERAEKAKPIAERLAERGKKLDAAIGEYCEHFAALGADIEELARLGVPVPSRSLVAVNMRRSHDAATMFLDKTSRPVPPLDRHPFSKLTTGWAVPALKWIEAKLNKSAAKSAA